jgi:hypothetical protein
MNTSFLAIVKRIIAEQGEAVLADPGRLKPFIKDYGQNVPQEERRAFGRCIEAGFYHRIKAAQTTAERQRLKAELARQLQNAAGISAALCSGALDVLDAAVPAGTPPSAAQTARGSGGTLSVSPAGAALPRITKRTLIFAAAAGLGAFLGALLSEPLSNNITHDSLGLIIYTCGRD